MYPLLYDFESLSIKSNFFKTFSKKYNIFFQVHYIPIHYFKIYKKKIDSKFVSLDNSNNFYKNVFSIPIHYNLARKDQNRIIKLINNFLGK